ARRTGYPVGRLRHPLARIVGGQTGLSRRIVLAAYASGVFPMADGRHDPEVFFVDPEFRGVIPLDHPSLPRRLGRTVRADVFQVRIDSDFARMLDACAAPDAGDRGDTWINDEIRRVCLDLHAG